MAEKTIDRASISLSEGRFARFEAIQWWQQSLLGDARVLVVGAGALGNEVIKNLALLGVGNLLIADMDVVESSNLSRSVLFRPGDEGKPKAAVAARAAGGLYPQIRAVPLVGNILSDLGMGCFRWAQVVVGALDNREARVFVNACCAQAGRPWIDGGIEVLSGIVRGFAPPQSACYECTMGQADWELLARRRSCSLLARRALREGGTPTTPTTASIIGAIQVQEVLKRLHGLDCLTGSGYAFEGLMHNSYSVRYPISPQCPWHEPQPPIEAVEHWNCDTPLRDIWDWAAGRLGHLDAIDLSRELVEGLHCPSCSVEQCVLQPIDRISADQAICRKCGVEMTPQFLHSLGQNSALLDLSIRQLGLPMWDVVWARRDDAMIGIELAGDRPVVLKKSTETQHGHPGNHEAGGSPDK
ncbi:MAG: ThiF family adenylyltransferase [Planctomycetes bacterium]|nr:ThiF family adenylyltransferase [Planctomycetota bacterium]